MNKKWEYKVINKKAGELHAIKQVTFLNEQGEQGWELCHTEISHTEMTTFISISYTFTFKREVL